MGFGQYVEPGQTEAVVGLRAHINGGCCETQNPDRRKLLGDFEPKKTKFAAGL